MVNIEFGIGLATLLSTMVVSDRLEEIVRGDSEHEVARFDLDFLVAVHSAQSNPQEK